MNTLLSADISKNLSKIQKFGWSVSDTPGQLLMIDKRELVIDHSYQRALNNDRANMFASSWSYIACGAISVSRRGALPGYYVIDGQHRVAAAMKRSDVDLLPCIVFQCASQIDEAVGFLSTNTNRKPLSTLQRMSAMVMSNDENAAYAENLAARAGRVFSSNSGPASIRCAGAMLKVVKDNKETVTALWPTLTKLMEGHPFHDRILFGLVWLETRIGDRSLTEKEIQSRLLKIGYVQLLDSIQRAVTFYNKGGSRIFAIGILEALNKGCRNRLSIVGESE